MKHKTNLSAAIILLSGALFAATGRAAPAGPPATEPAEAEVVIYGGTPAGVMAAVAAARQGHSVALIDPNNHVGGVVSGGLVATDIGDRKSVGGLADDFLSRIAKYYRDTYGPDSEQFTACRNGLKYEPHVAEATFDQMLREQPNVKVFKQMRFKSVSVDNERVTAIEADDLKSGETRAFRGQVFIDASYEGDLTAAAGVPCRVGRESRSEYGEYLAGISAGPRECRGLGDHRVMAYNYRVSLTGRKENAVPFPKPEHYDPEPWRATYGVRIRNRNIEHFADLYVNPAAEMLPNGKFDSNWCDLVGGSEGYAEGNWETRARLEARQRDYFLSLVYYLQNDPELPEKFHADAQNWGLSKDEFTDNGNFPFQYYVREARRMIGRYVLREQDITQDRYKPDGIATGSYGVDCHTVQVLTEDGKPTIDHTRHVAHDDYDIPYACMTPFEPANLLVPVCLSTTHVAYCSVRMEPVFMMLGQAAGDAAHLAIANKSSVQKVDVGQLRELLKKEGAILDRGYQPPVAIVWSPQRPRPGEAVLFHLSARELKDPIAKAWWDFEGDGRVSSAGDKAQHSFPLDKVYNVSLIVEDQAGRRRMVAIELPVGTAWARDVTIDDFDADLFGRWDGTYPQTAKGLADVFLGPGMQRDVVRDGKRSPARARFQPDIPRPGRYQVCLGFRPAKNQATNVPIVIHHAGGVTRLMANERSTGSPATQSATSTISAGDSPFPFVPLGEFRFRAGKAGYVELTNANADGHVVIDGVRWVWLGE